MKKDITQLLRPRDFDEVSLNSLHLVQAPKKAKMQLEKLHVRRPSLRCHTPTNEIASSGQRLRQQMLQRSQKASKHYQADFDKKQVGRVLEQSYFQEVPRHSTYCADFPKSVTNQAQEYKGMKALFERNKEAGTRRQQVTERQPASPSKGIIKKLFCPQERPEEEQPEEQQVAQMEQLLQSYQGRISLDQFVEDNTDYISHVFKLCKCFKCTCSQCKCEYEMMNVHKVKFRVGIKSMYGSSFRRNEVQPEEPTIDQRTYNIHNGVKPGYVDLQSISRSDFKGRRVEGRNPRFRYSQMAQDLSRHSSKEGEDYKYNTQTANYQHTVNNQQNNFKPHDSDTPEMQLMASNYQQDFPDYKGTHPNFNRYHAHSKFKQDYVGGKSENVKSEAQEHFEGKGRARRVSFKNSEYCLPIVPQLDPMTTMAGRTSLDFKTPGGFQYDVPRRNTKRVYINPGHTKYDGMYKSINKKDFQGNQEKSCGAHDGMTTQQVKQIILDRLSHLAEVRNGIK